MANWLGFDLMTNFRMPYLAISPSDFWQRWHISLSQWLRDYLYIPLGGNRRGNLQTYRNLMTTMLLGGLWHGANWTFLAWGAFHGTLLCFWRAFVDKKPTAKPVDRQLPTPCGETPTHRPSFAHFLRVVFFFNLICFSWLLFRAESMTQAWEMTAKLATDFTMTPFARMACGLIVFYVTPLMLFEIWLEWKRDALCLLNVHWCVRGLVYLYVVYMMMFFPPPVPSEFIYFQF